MRCPRCQGFCLPDQNSFESWHACINCGRRMNVVDVAAVKPMPEKIEVSEAVKNQTKRRTFDASSEWVENKWKPPPIAKVLAQKYYDSIAAQVAARAKWLTIARLLNQACNSRVQAPFLEHYFKLEQQKREAGHGTEDSATKKASCTSQDSV